MASIRRTEHPAATASATSEAKHHNDKEGGMSRQAHAAAMEAEGRGGTAREAGRAEAGESSTKEVHIARAEQHLVPRNSAHRKWVGEAGAAAAQRG